MDWKVDADTSTENEVARLRDILFQVANDSRCFVLHERTKELLKEFQIKGDPK